MLTEIFTHKRKTEPKLPSGFLVTGNEKGWMNEVIMP
jgi:hypothetical protein